MSDNCYSLLLVNKKPLFLFYKYNSDNDNNDYVIVIL